MTLANEFRNIISGIYFEYQKKRICLWGLISTTEITHVYKDKSGFTLNLPQKSSLYAPPFSQNAVPQNWRLCHRHFLKRNAAGSYCERGKEYAYGDKVLSNLCFERLLGNLSTPNCPIKLRRQCIKRQSAIVKRIMMLYSVE